MGISYFVTFSSAFYYIGQFERGKMLPSYTRVRSIVSTLDVDANLFFEREAVDYPDEAKWIARIFSELSAEDKQTVGKFLEDYAKVFLTSNIKNGETR